MAKPNPNLLFLAFVLGAISAECVDENCDRLGTGSPNLIFFQDSIRSKLLEKLFSIWRCRLPPTSLDGTAVDWEFLRFPPQQEQLVRDWMEGKVDLVGTTPPTPQPTA